MNWASRGRFTLQAILLSFFAVTFNAHSVIDNSRIFVDKKSRDGHNFVRVGGIRDGQGHTIPYSVHNGVVLVAGVL